MEQKKTLWIVAAAGIFLLVVVGAALIIYSPSLHNTPVQQASFDPATGWVNASSVSGDTKSYDSPATTAPDAFPEDSGKSNFDQLNSPDFDKNSGSALSESAFPGSGLSENADGNISGGQLSSSIANGENQAENANPTIKADSVNIYSQTTTTFDLNALKASNSQNLTAQNEKTYAQLESARANAASAQNTDNSSSAQNTSYSSQNRENFAGENYYAPKARSTNAYTSASKSSSEANAAKPASPAKQTNAVSASSSSAKNTKTAASTAQKIAVASKTPQNLFWVQVGAYSSKKNADSARAVLEENKIPVEVFTDSKYFKVRVGPYQTKSEASYWQKMISEIGKFADSKTMIITSPVQK